MIGAALLPPPLDRPIPKTFRAGTHRTVSPTETLARVRLLLPAMGITRVADITGLDRIGIPTVAVYRPNARSVSVTMGKGLDLAAAKASGVMEAVETYHAEYAGLPLRLGSYRELRHRLALVDVEGLPRGPDSVFHPRMPLLWAEGLELLGGGRVWVPYDIVHMNWTLPMPTGSGCFLASSAGLASGNHLLEAISHGICELVERDSSALWLLRDEEEQAATRLDPDTVDDPACRAVLALYDRAAVAVAIWETTTEIGIPSFMCTIAERSEEPLHPVPIRDGHGCHPAREVALLRALTEAAQSRLTIISGARDNIPRADYENMLNADILRLRRGLVETGGPLRDFRAVPTFDGATVNADVVWELDRLRAAGLGQVVAVDLTRDELGLAVARVIVPGLGGTGAISGYSARTRPKAGP